MLSDALLAFGTLLPIVNPVSASFVFNALTRNDSKEKKLRIARQAAVTSLLMLLLFLFIGSTILSFFGITIYAFRVAGGIYLGIIAYRMLGHKLRHDPEDYHDNPKDIAVIPIAVPLLSGPGAITSVLVLSETAGVASISIAVAAVALLSFLALAYAHVINRALGRTGTNVVEKILGLLVLVIAVQFIFNGITDYLSQL